MATYLLVFLGTVAIASTVVGLLGAAVVAAMEWILGQAQSRHVVSGHPYAEQQPTFTGAHDELDVYHAATAAYHPRWPR